MQKEELPEYDLKDTLDVSIVMHREVHFGGRFDFMLDYYHKKGKGVQEEFSLKRIEELAVLEKAMEKNLAPLLLSGADTELVARAKESYKQLRALYHSKDKANRYPLLIADLILTEEEEAEEETAAILAEEEKIVPELLALIRSEDFHNPLFPGFGQAPLLAAKCLGEIGDKRAIIALFESIGADSGDFFDEIVALKALHAIGEPAKEFLLKVVQSKPYNSDNERAAIALGEFPEDPIIAKTCLNILQDPDARRDPLFGTYLILACKGLRDTPEAEAFKALANNPQTPSTWRTDMQAILKDWKQA